MRLHREQLRHVEQLRQQREAPAVRAHEILAEQRLRMHGEQRGQRHRRAVGQVHDARMLPRLVVGIVGRELERLAEPARRRTPDEVEPLESAKPVAAPRPLDEVVAPRLQQAGRELCRGRAVAPEQAIGQSALLQQQHGSHTRMPQYATAVYVKT
jgi:hypothetical protein